MLFNEWLTTELNDRKWKNAELERKGGLDSGLVSNLLNGNRKPSVQNCKDIAKAFDYPQEVVFRVAGLLDPKPDDDPLLEEWAHIFNQAESEEERKRLIELARFELKRILKSKE